MMMPVTGQGIGFLILIIIVAVVFGVWLSGYGNCCDLSSPLH